MPRITLLAVGKIKNPHLKALEEDFAERLSHYTPFSIKEVRENKFEGTFKPEDFVVALDERGKTFTSTTLATLLREKQNRSVKHIIFVVGDAYALDPAVKTRANLTLALSA
ncbi:MAG: 23S rRNA (pseudouridine(1915)-N(3))-methyltransferase RlmH, partial [Deltaproteobacteria bacterium]|nr:23S rRNA (pseudouridine(1915)-N(3))-methyltransferase RlmH [Deltaproteobacteria bacterium]